jgi:hypothetical protein
LQGWLEFIVAVLGTYRLVGMLAYDDGPLDCFATLRGRTQFDRYGNRREGALWESARKLVQCPYCLGVWFALPLSLLVSQGKGLGRVLGFWLGVAGGQSLIQGLDPTTRG